MSTLRVFLVQYILYQKEEKKWESYDFNQGQFATVYIQASITIWIQNIWITFGRRLRKIMNTKLVEEKRGPIFINDDKTKFN